MAMAMSRASIRPSAAAAAAAIVRVVSCQPQKEPLFGEQPKKKIVKKKNGDAGDASVVSCSEKVWMESTASSSVFDSGETSARSGTASAPSEIGVADAGDASVVSCSEKVPRRLRSRCSFT